MLAEDMVGLRAAAGPYTLIILVILFVLGQGLLAYGDFFC